MSKHEKKIKKLLTNDVDHKGSKNNYPSPASIGRRWLLERITFLGARGGIISISRIFLQLYHFFGCDNYSQQNVHTVAYLNASHY